MEKNNIKIHLEREEMCLELNNCLNHKKSIISRINKLRVDNKMNL